LPKGRYIVYLLHWNFVGAKALAGATWLGAFPVQFPTWSCNSLYEWANLQFRILDH
jgi:hypothetical protein